MLVAPVLRPGARERRAYLPAGTDWTHHGTGTVHRGGSWVTVPAPLDAVPFFVRARTDPFSSVREER
jgi:alpha-D-xyloside xylohydrolase